MTRGSYASVHWLKIFLCFLYGFISDGVAAAAAPLMCAYLHTMGNIITRFGGIFAWRQPHAPVPRHPGTLYSSYFVGWRRRLSVVSRRVLLRITLAPTLIGMTSTCPPPFSQHGSAVAVLGACVCYCGAPLPSLFGRAERLHYCATVVLVCGLSSYYG